MKQLRVVFEDAKLNKMIEEEIQKSLKQTFAEHPKMSKEEKYWYEETLRTGVGVSLLHKLKSKQLLKETYAVTGYYKKSRAQYEAFCNERLSK